MALIQCNNCGQEISEKAKKCPHCGTDIANSYITEAENITLVCNECGTSFSCEMDSCPKCGCPASEKETPQKVEITNVDISNVKNKIKKPLIITAISIILIAVIAFFGTQIAAENRAKTYAETLEKASSEMLLGAAAAEEAGNLIKNVWSDSISEEYDSETREYTRPNGYYVDFNTALSNLFADEDFSSKLSYIKSNQTKVTNLMKDLNNPPEEYQEAYSAIKSYYDAYLELTDLVIDPSGSLITFSNNFNEADSETYSCYKKMKMYIE